MTKKKKKMLRYYQIYTLVNTKLTSLLSSLLLKMLMTIEASKGC